MCGKRMSGFDLGRQGRWHTQFQTKTPIYTQHALHDHDLRHSTKIINITHVHVEKHGCVATNSTWVCVVVIMCVHVLDYMLVLYQSELFIEPG